jgi:hypothetical protein
MKRNPKQEGSALFDCIPQSGNCPIGCNQCFFNRKGAFYCETPLVPSVEEIEKVCEEEWINDPIVRMNCGHDSNIERDKVIEASKEYEDVFFNTSQPNLNFPGPVVYTANSSEEEKATLLTDIPKNLMFVRLRVSATNLPFISEAAGHYTAYQIPVVLTFMAYYEKIPEHVRDSYEWKIRHINSYWCPKETFVKRVMNWFSHNWLVVLCGPRWCRDCRNCETYYWQTKRRLS